jgi:hypothetical protein
LAKGSVCDARHGGYKDGVRKDVGSDLHEQGLTDQRNEEAGSESISA